MAKPQIKKSLDAFNQELGQLHMTGQWIYEDLLNQAIGGPRPRGEPYLWPWKMVYEKLEEACEVLEESFTARRSLLFGNPGLPNNATTHTLLMGIQMIKPGEIAWAHRHTLAAIRFVIKGDGRVYTVVDGEKCPMESYDLILTPQWTWHDHHNPTEETAIWVDALDVPFILGLNLPFYEPYPGNRVQALREKRSDYLQERSGAVRPIWEVGKTENLPLRYAWSDIKPQLWALAETEGSPYDGVALEYVNPVTGGPTLPTLSCWIQLLRPGERTKRHRHTSSAVYFVVSGEGTTIVGEKSLNWTKHDCFAVPNWAWHEHVNRSKAEAMLFSVNDIPIVSGFGLYREEPEISLHTTQAPQVPAAGKR
ncbi:MAG TPA: cupin domain-containing protein [Candidatus Eisenbacteria bacterium]|nr:cupin domain-containing protein [Candidatus Eisenbacteria bacterium]